jgi:hypothetical protein
MRILVGRLRSLDDTPFGAASASSRCGIGVGRRPRSQTRASLLGCALLAQASLALPVSLTLRP